MQRSTSSRFVDALSHRGIRLTHDWFRQPETGSALRSLSFALTNASSASRCRALYAQRVCPQHGVLSQTG